MTHEDGFLAQLASLPADDTVRLVYADWLEEQGTDEANRKAEFLRLMCGWFLSSEERQAEIKDQLQSLAAELDPRWSAVISNPAIENCAGRRQKGGMRLFTFDLVCDKKWADMAPTAEAGVRHCGACRRDVYFCETITEARKHAWDGHCIAVDLGVIRRTNDLNPPMGVVGRPSAEYMREQEELRLPDPVSAERERRKANREGTK